MSDNKDRSFYISFLASLKNFVSTSHKSINDIIIKYDLPPEVMFNLRSADFCNFQLNRMCNILEYIISPKALSDEPILESFDPLHLITELAHTFEQNVAGFLPMTTDCYSKLSKHLPIMVNKAKFELVFLNLLYCSLRSAEESNSRTTKLTFYITENKDFTVFHLRDNCQNINPQIANSIFSDSSAAPIIENNSDAIIAISLEAAAKATEELKGILSYKALKSGNRYDIALPRLIKNRHLAATSLSRYIPTHPYYDLILADIHLEILHKKAEKGELSI